jgi:hypothetical protein
MSEIHDARHEHDANANDQPSSGCALSLIRDHHRFDEDRAPALFFISDEFFAAGESHYRGHP